MKEMLAGFAPNRETSGNIGTRVKSALDGLADTDVLIVDTFADGNTLPVALDGGFTYVVKIEVEDNCTAPDTIGQIQVRIHVALVKIDHEVGILPEVPGAVTGASGRSRGIV